MRNGKPMELHQESIRHYKVHLKINPKEQHIDSRCLLTFRVPSPEIDRLGFYLHKQLTVEDIKCNKHIAAWFEKDPADPVHYMPYSRMVHLDFGKPLEKDEQIELGFKYEGKITDWPEWSANIISEDWTELGLYFPWFPYNPDYGDFTFSVDVECDPSYQVCSYGERVKFGTIWQIKWDQPTNDIVITLSKDIETHTTKVNNFMVQVNAVTISNATAAMISKDISTILTCFDRWFLGKKHGQVSIIQSPREKGGGYTRRGLIVLGGLKDTQYSDLHEAYTRYLGHEVAHLWWWSADTTSWEDWLNEGFAEYSALLMVKEIFGQNAFEKRLADKQKALEGTAPIWGFKRSDTTSEEKMREIELILYSKGPVLLHQLVKKIGDARFLNVCRQMIVQKVSSTNQFIEILCALEGHEVGKWMENNLKTK
jgi:hypothetical protein